MAAATSAASIVRRRSHRSTSAPAKGPITTAGTEKARAIIARFVTDPVSRYTQNWTAKALIVEPRPETSCPPHTVKKLRSDTVVSVVASMVIGLLVRSESRVESSEFRVQSENWSVLTPNSELQTPDLL